MFLTQIQGYPVPTIWVDTQQLGAAGWMLADEHGTPITDESDRRTVTDRGQALPDRTDLGANQEEIKVDTL